MEERKGSLVHEYEEKMTQGGLVDGIVENVEGEILETKFACESPKSNTSNLIRLHANCSFSPGTMGSRQNLLASDLILHDPQLGCAQ
jgi:hypothetical protein